MRTKLGKSKAGQSIINQQAPRGNSRAFLLSVPVDNFVDKYRLFYGVLWISLWITIVPVGLTPTNGLVIVSPQLSPSA